MSVDVAEVIGGMAELLARTLGPAVRLQMKLEAGLWPVMLDPNQFEAAIVNLALNASAAMPRGGRMSVAAANIVLAEAAVDVPPGDYVRVALADSGIGMSAETVSRARRYPRRRDGTKTGVRSSGPCERERRLVPFHPVPGPRAPRRSHVVRHDQCRPRR